MGLENFNWTSGVCVTGKHAECNGICPGFTAAVFHCACACHQERQAINDQHERDLKYETPL